MPHPDRYADAIAAIDAANADDPATLLVDDAPRPKEQTHAEMMTAWVLRLRPDASETLLLAARAHHLRRWMIPRDAFPAGRSAYLRWRRALHHVHAELAAAILEQHGYRRAEVERVHALIAKETLLQQGDEEAQTLEDALSLVFFQTQLESTMPDLDERQQRRVVGRTWRKMSPAAQQALREMELSNDARQALAGILPDFGPKSGQESAPESEPESEQARAQAEADA